MQLVDLANIRGQRSAGLKMEVSESASWIHALFDFVYLDHVLCI
jgi:hypothetical protein